MKIFIDYFLYMVVMILVGLLFLWLFWGETLDPSFLFLSHLFSLDYAFKENYGKSLVEIF